jgi:hypothetical protein
MKSACYFIVLFIGISTHAFSQHNDQSVISAGGDISRSTNLILEWTLGEPSIESVSTSSSLYTQGFHQPLLKVQPVNYVANNSTKNVFHVFPNPATTVLNIQLDYAAKEPLLVSLLNVNGSVLLNSSFPQKAIAAKLDVSRFPHGTYLLRITNQEGSIHSEFKVIKTQ